MQENVSNLHESRLEIKLQDDDMSYQGADTSMSMLQSPINSSRVNLMKNAVLPKDSNMFHSQISLSNLMNNDGYQEGIQTAKLDIYRLSDDKTNVSPQIGRGRNYATESKSIHNNFGEVSILNTIDVINFRGNSIEKSRNMAILESK